MKRPDDKFTETPFYQEREAEILERLERTTLPSTPLPGKLTDQTYSLSDAIYYAGCVAGSLGLPVDSESMCQQLEILRTNAKDGQWSVIARLLAELYARANEEAIAHIKSDPALTAQPWALVRMGQGSPPSHHFENPPAPPPARGVPLQGADGGPRT